MRRVKLCRSCGSGELVNFLNLGRLPLDSVVGLEQLGQPEERRSLEVAFCKRCGLVQQMGRLGEEAYIPLTPAQMGLSEHLLPGTQGLVLALAGSSLEVLRQLMQAGLRLIYFEPQAERARLASNKGIPTRALALDRAQAKRLQEEGLQADMVLVNQGLAYHPDPNGLMESLRLLLKEQGWVVLELPYFRAQLEARQFNRFTFQQLNYFSVAALQHLARRHGLWLQQLEPLPYGYLRGYLGQTGQVDPSVEWYLEEEERWGLGEASYYLEFAAQVAAVREALLVLLSELRARGRSIAAVGSEAQAAILLNYVGLGREIIDFVVGEEPGAVGRFIAGVHIPIYGAQKLLEAEPDYLLLLSHSPAEVEQICPAYQGKRIVALPYPDILSPLAQRRKPWALGR
ncbi:class I SAM-dependent methyltransferase [Meiothermus rufus]|uniref:class I SAM-dependent methyltransferase n=1 Tax=Meiothermus rufus TaxID=604332 RepID=UPI000419CAD4|nr:class I SAM-dependent methyltransferase [Meiothermus rufus]